MPIDPAAYPDPVALAGYVVAGMSAVVTATLGALHKAGAIDLRPNRTTEDHPCRRSGEIDKMKRTLYGEPDAGHPGLVEQVARANEKLDTLLGLARSMSEATNAPKP